MFEPISFVLSATLVGDKVRNIDCPQRKGEVTKLDAAGDPTIRFDSGHRKGQEVKKKSKH